MPDESSLGNMAHRFRTTRWPVVLLSAQSQAPGFQAALGELCGIYWYPPYAYIRRRDQTPEEAQELTQCFFLRRQFKEVGCTVSDPAEIEEELCAHCGALIASEGRLEL